MPTKRKGMLAEFFAFQAVRGPRWKKRHHDFTRREFAERRRDPEPILRNGIWLPVTHSALNEIEDDLLSETKWLQRMMSVANKVIEVFGSMTWDLIEFEEPWLAISDHPVSAFPLSHSRVEPGPFALDHGVLNT